MDKTKIEWADATWNPVTGCFHGCEYCYARRIAERFAPLCTPRLGDPGMEGAAKWDSDRGLDTMLELEKPYKPEGRVVPYPMGFFPTFHRYRLNQPAKWKEPRTIFVCSMADLFGEWVPDEWIEAVFRACLDAPQHRYLFLTKNPECYQSLAYRGLLPKRDNFWYGSTATGPYKPVFYGEGFHTFVSVEPILEDFGCCPDDPERSLASCTDWIILGAESGNRRDKVTPKAAWIEGLVADYSKWDKPVFMKDSLIPVVGEKNMRREFPWEDAEEAEKRIATGAPRPRNDSGGEAAE